jgi:hypothetical protein
MSTPEDANNNQNELVKKIVEYLLEKLKGTRFLPIQRMAYSESEAAKMLGLNPWQLGEERKKEKIEHVRTVGRRIRYTPQQIQDYLVKNTQRGN